ncbi:MAG TPA: hypothetical protein VFF07_13540 [Actinomycetota bacterium]|nr:hypothetical protein [Actinomycetota bacterium]
MPPSIKPFQRRYAVMQRLHIYLDFRLKSQVRAEAARSGVSLSQYCVDAIRRRLAEDGIGSPTPDTATSAAAIDNARRRNGPLGVPVRELIDEGRRA